MKGLRGWLLVSRVILLAPKGYAQMTPSRAGLIAKPEPSKVRTFDLRESFLIVVDARIGPLEHLKFILDTGASYTVVSRKIADQLALPWEPGSVINVPKKLPMEGARFPEVQVGPIVATDVRMMVADLNQYSELPRTSMPSWVSTCLADANGCRSIRRPNRLPSRHGVAPCKLHLLKGKASS